MDSASLGMLLPEGIVVNSSEIYKEVASYPVIPPEKIWQYWHVYTTTFRKLIDPKAHRLENFWWHVWGSDRRYLSGPALAKLYEDISTGPTFADLHAQNRWREPLSPVRSNDDSQEDNEHSEKSPRKQRRADSGKASSSSSKPTPPPILKKSRGPSTPGPRPTARFVTPRDSEDEGEQDSQEVSSGSTAALGLEMRHHSTIYPDKSDKKKATPVTKKFVVSSSASKKRPVLPRRGSSQSSTTSEIISKEGGSSAGPRYLGSQRSVHTIPEHTGDSGTLRSQDSSSPGEVLTMSTRASGKRPAATPTKKRHSIVNGGPNPNSSQSRPVVVQTTGAVPRVRSAERVQFQTHLDSINQRRNEGQIPQPTYAGGYLTQRQGHPYPMTRSMSSHERHRPRELNIGHAPPQGLTSGATAGTTNVAVQGTLIGSTDEIISPPLNSPMLPTQVPAVQEVGSMTSSGLLRGGVDLPSRSSMTSLLGDIRDAPAAALPSIPSSSSLLDSRLATPTQRSSAPTVPLGRSKSQLTLLLERENARIAEKPRAKNNS